MKTILALSLFAAGTLTGFAQGTINFGNTTPTRVFNAFTMAPVAVGTTFLVALHYAPDGTPTDASMIQLGASTGFVFPGIFSDGTRTTPGTTAPGGFALFQVRVWESAFGTSYDQAVNAPAMGGRFALTARSACLRGGTGNPVSVPPHIPRNLVEAGLQSFFVPDLLGGAPMACPVPEPNAWLFAGAGLAALGLAHYFRARRKG